MSGNVVINRLSDLFSKEDTSTIVKSLHRDPLVWKTISSMPSLDQFISFAGNKIDKWSPGYLAAVMIDPSFELAKMIDQEIIPVNDQLRSEVESIIETIKSTGLIPDSLNQAGLLSLYLRIYRQEQDSWKKIIEKLLIKTNISSPVTLSKIWQSTFACLPSFVEDYNDLAFELITTSPEIFREQIVSLVLHGLLTQPHSKEQILNEIQIIFSHLDADVQVSSLKLLNDLGLLEYVHDLANNYLKLNENLNATSLAISETYTLGSSTSIIFDHIVNLEKQADFYKYAGHFDQASKIRAHTVELLNQNISRLYFQLGVDNSEIDPQAAKTAFINALNFSPNSDNIKKEYVRFLLSQNEIEEAKQIFPEIESSVDTKFIALQNPAVESNFANISVKDIVTFFSDSTISPQVKKSILPKVLKHESLLENHEDAQKLVNSLLLQFPEDPIILDEAINLHRSLGENEKALNILELRSIFETESEEIKEQLIDLYIVNKLWAEAFDLQNEVITNTNNPTHDQLLKYASIAIENDKPDIAISICRNILNKDQLDGEALVILGNAYIKSDQKSLAIEHMERAASLSPENPASWLALANIWKKLGDSNRVLDTLLKGKTALPDDFSILRALGSAYLENDLASNAVPILKQALLINPEDLATRISLAKSFFVIGQTDEAWNIVSPFLKEYLKDYQLALIIGMLYLSRTDNFKAYPYLKYAYTSERSEETIIPYAKLLMELYDNKSNVNVQVLTSEIKELETTIEELIKETTDSYNLSVLLADLNLAVGEYQQAYEKYLFLAGLPPAKSPVNYEHIQYGIGKSALGLNYNEISLAALHEAVMNNPNDHFPRQTLAKAYIQAGSVEEGLESANIALQISPDNIQNILWYADFVTEIGAPRHALLVLRNAIVRYPERQDLHLALTKTLFLLGDHSEARKIIEMMVSNRTAETEELQQVAKLLITLNDNETAANVLKSALMSSQSPSTSIIHDLCLSLIKLGDFEGALEIVTSYIEKPGADDMLTILKSDLFSYAARFGDAIAELSPVFNKLKSGLPMTIEREYLIDQTHIIADYSSEGVYYRQIELELITGNFLTALDLSKAAITHFPNSTDLLFLYLTLLFAGRKSQEFVDLYQRSNDNQALPITDPSKIQTLIWMRCEIALENEEFDYAENLITSLPKDSEPQISILSAKARIDGFYKQDQKAFDCFDRLIENVNNLRQEHQHSLLSISDRTNFIWDLLSLARTATSQQKWDTAYELYLHCQSLCQVLPVMNYWFCDFLLLLIQTQRKNHALRITTHGPSVNVDSAEFTEFLENLISTTERFADQEVSHTLKVKHNAVLTGSWPETEELGVHIKNLQDAITILPILKNQQQIDSITNAYPGNFDLKFTNAVRAFEFDREHCNNLLPELFSIDTSYPPLHVLNALCNDNDDYIVIHSLETALLNWDNEPEWHQFLAEKYFATEQFPLAASHLENAIDITPDNPGYWQLLGDVKIRERDFDSAKKYFSQAISIFPNNPAALSSLAILNRKLGDFDSAINCLKSAINLDPNNTNYRNSLTQLYMEIGEFDKASKDANELISLDPNDVTPKAIYIKTMLAGNHLQDAKTILANWLIDYPNSIELRLLEAQLTYKLNGCADAITILSALAHKHPEDVTVLNEYAEILIECNYIDEAEKVLQQSLAFNPEQSETYISLGRLYRNKGNLDLAISMFTKSLSIDPGIYKSYLELGKTYQNRREYQNAIKTYLQGLQTFSESPILHYNAGIAYKECKDYKNAEAMLRQAAQLDPNDTMIRRQLAGVIALNLVHNLQEPKNHEYR